MSVKETLSLISHLIQNILGIEISLRNLYWENVLEVIGIIFALYFVTPAVFEIIDSLVESYNLTGIEAFTISGFKGSFILSSVYLILLGLFSGIKNIFIKFYKVIFGGVLIGAVITILLIVLKDALFDILNSFNYANTLLISFFSIYPILYAIAVRLQISQEIRR